MKHSVMIPDDVWEWWQQHTGQIKPARAIRDEVVKATLRLKFIEEQQVVEDFLPGAIDFDVDDTPTAITLERTAVCMHCLKVMKKGEEAFWFTSRGRKHAAHPECWEKNREESQDTT